MEVLENSLFLDQVPPIWTARAYPSLLGLTSWFVDLLMRLRELETWSTDFVVIVFSALKFSAFLFHLADCRIDENDFSFLPLFG